MKIFEIITLRVEIDTMGYAYKSELSTTAQLKWDSQSDPVLLTIYIK